MAFRTKSRSRSIVTWHRHRILLPGIAFPLPTIGRPPCFGQMLPKRCSRVGQTMSASRSISVSASGTRFGCSVVETRGDRMDVPEQNLRESDPLMLTPRRRERRRGVEQLTGVLARGVGDRLDSWSMRAGFEETLRSALALRTVQLRDAGTKWAAPSDGPAGVTSLAFDVASTVPGARGLLTVTFEPGRRLDEWDYQALETS